MAEEIHERISVITVYDHIKGKSTPWRIKWQGRVYQVTKLGLHHTRENGTVLHHIFSVIAGGMFFRLDFNTLNLSWLVTHIEDATDNTTY